MYCVPSSFVNACGYLRDNGMRTMLGGSNPNSHAEITYLLLLMGAPMGTDPTKGIKGSYPVEWSWVDWKTSKLVYLGAWSPTGSWNHDTVMDLFRSGAMVRLGYGRYANVNGTWFRTGGPAVTRNLRGRVAAIDVDEVTGGFVALDAKLGGTTAYDTDFVTSRREPLLGIVPARPVTNIAVGEAVFSVDSETGDYLVAVTGEQGWTRFARAGAARFGTRVTAKVAGGVQGLMAGPQGTVFVQNGSNRLDAYSHTGSIRPSEFTGLQARGPFQIPKSFRAVRPGQMTGPGWNDVPPEGNNP